MSFRIFILFFICCYAIAFAQHNNAVSEKEKINQYLETINKDSTIWKNQFYTIENGVKMQYEFWKKGKEIVYIKRSHDVDNGEYIDNYGDDFFLENGKRVYAIQSIIYHKKTDHEDMGGWKVWFWIKNNVVFDMSSLGHGKTEMDDWDFEKELDHNFKIMTKAVSIAEKNKTAKEIK